MPRRFMPPWTVEKRYSEEEDSWPLGPVTNISHSTFAFALKKVTISGFRKALKEEDRIAIAATILEHLKLCRWEFSKPPEPAGGLVERLEHLRGL